MKKILFLVAILSIVINAQRTETSSFAIKLKYENKTNSGYVVASQNDKGFITGVMSGDDSLITGSTSQLHQDYLNSFSENYWKYSKGEALTETSVPTKTNPERMVLYSLYPRRTLTDSLLVYCKYVLYTLNTKEQITGSNFEIKYHEEFIKVLPNTDITLGFIQKNFPKSIVSLRIVPGDEAFRKTQVVDKSPFPFDENKLKEFASKSNVLENDLTFGIDLIRTNRTGSQTLIKRTDFPLKPFTVNIGEGSSPVSKILYYGYIQVPFQIYSQEKVELFNQSDRSKDISFYSVYIIPTEKEKNSYNLELIISNGDNKGNYSYSKKISLAKGDKIKIELQPGNWRYQEVVKGEKLELNSEEDYNKFVKDFIILSLDENAGGNNQTSNSAVNKDKIVETLTPEENERRVINKELQELAKMMMDEYKDRHVDVKRWKIPDNFFKKFHYASYNLIDMNNGIEIEGIGKYKGNDNLSPVRLSIKITTENKNTVRHTVRVGESIGSIARKYNVTDYQIREWNNGARRLRDGQQINIYGNGHSNTPVISKVIVNN